MRMNDVGERIGDVEKKRKKERVMWQLLLGKPKKLLSSNKVF